MTSQSHPCFRKCKWRSESLRPGSKLVQKGRHSKPLLNTSSCANQESEIDRTERQKVMTIAHDSILGGHLGTKKILDQISSSFSWPGIQGDVKRYSQG
ncbi:uncharacterized protein LOC111111486 isoform X3 [Crassostrea virginica]